MVNPMVNSDQSFSQIPLIGSKNIFHDTHIQSNLKVEFDAN